MPAYDYACASCGFVSEEVHGMTESPKYECSYCGTLMGRVYLPFNFSSRLTTLHGKMQEKLRRESDMEADLKENYGVENVVPIGASGMGEVYSEVKGGGSFVKERMQQEKEVKDVERINKQREWKSKAQKRADGRGRERIERKKAEDCNKRAIRLQRKSFDQ